MNNNIYAYPEKFGLSIVGEVDYSDGCYCFDLLVVFSDNGTGQLSYGEDSGCSCPSPFEFFGGIDELVCGTKYEIAEKIQKRLEPIYEFQTIHGEQAAADLIARLMTVQQ